MYLVQKTVPPVSPNTELPKRTIEAILAPVQSGLEQVEQKMRGVDDTLFAPLASSFTKLVDSGGKRLRPALALMSAQLNGPLQGTSDYERVLASAASVEVLHTATLVHDDVIDEAKIRRGTATLNARWNEGTTVLAGNYMFGHSAHLAAQTGNMRVIDIFSDTLQTLVDGELHQISARDDYEQDKNLYYERIYAKTASLFCTATESSAVLSGLDDGAIEQLRAYGYNFGMAFQIMDDILDFIGDEQTLGKPAGSDLRQGTFTLPFLHFAQSNQDLVAAYRQARAQEKNLHDIVNEIVGKLRVSDAIPAARQEAIDFLDLAHANLSAFPDTIYRRSMLDLCTFVVERTY